MRMILSFILLLLLNIGSAQNYSLFNSGSKKLFTTYPIPSKTYSLAFDSVIFSGTDSTYYNYFNVNDTFVNSNCPWWGPTWCWPQNFSSWMGRKIINSNNFNYIFFNNFNDSLQFNFNIIVNDTGVFYQDSIQIFGFVYEKIDTMNLFNIIDSARYYKIFHTDNTGNVITSNLNNEYIIIGKSFGLIKFFQIDSFPQTQNSIFLIGNENPNGGFTSLTNEVLYDYNIGDEIQYHRTYYASAGPPSQNYNYYVKYGILNKILTTDSIKYIATRYLFYVDSTFAIQDTITLSYYRYTIVASIPFEKFDSYNKTLYQEDYCGLKLWTFKTIHFPYWGYCQIEKCWGSIDTGGPAPQTTNIYVAGLGDYDLSTSLLAGPSPANNYSDHTEMVYFKKNNVTCGIPVILSVPEHLNYEGIIKIIPNPAESNFKIASPLIIKEIVIIDPLGKIVLKTKSLNSDNLIDCSDLSEGIYLIDILLMDGNKSLKKIVITKSTK